ncbi:MAG: Na/Pi cotransporter family protein [Erysipelotrichaceae bacterium]|nr:Na/Pi cotransporter family protein [Erysipelotrichaceae bacterium]
MTTDNILSLFGGLALFLYGMHMMSEGLEEAAGDKMKQILEKLTSNRFLGIIVGALITAVIQSSSATTVMVVGFVNSGLMTLQQAVWIIMGANIGTTITGQLVALSVSDMAPILAIIGVIMVTFISNKKANSIGEILAGLGVLFIGMNMMSSAMSPLRTEPLFIDFMTTISNPFIAVVFGAAFTALIQSSSASVGILQTIAMGGLIPLSSSIYIIFGQNIGTCITAVLASLSAKRSAKRTTVIHLSFNLIGTALFMILIQFIPFVDWMVTLTDNAAAQIANTHTIFNVTTSILLIPFGTYLAKLAETVLPVLPNENKEEITLSFIDDKNIGNTAIAMANLRKEANAMLEMTQTNLIQSVGRMTGNNYSFEEIDHREDKINGINYKVAEYMSKVSLLQMNQQESDICNALYKSFADIERVGDHAFNIAQYSLELDKGTLDASMCAQINELTALLIKTIDILMHEDVLKIESDGEVIEAIEQKIDDLTALYRQQQIERLINKEVDAKDCVTFSQMMTDIERISDHLLNIMEEYRKVHISLTQQLFNNAD